MLIGYLLAGGIPVLRKEASSGIGPTGRPETQPDLIKARRLLNVQFGYRRFGGLTALAQERESQTNNNKAA